MRGNAATLAIAVAAATLLLAGSASAEEPRGRRPGPNTSGQVEPICQTNTEANKRILKDVRKKVKDGKLKQAGGQFIQRLGKPSARPWRKSPKRCRDRPPTTPACSKWFKHSSTSSDEPAQTRQGAERRRQDPRRPRRIRAERSSNAANNVSFVFGFQYCRIAPGRFTSS